MHIEESDNSQTEDILRLHSDAFGPSEGPAIAQLVKDLLVATDAQPHLSLVAVEGGICVGHILFTPVTIDQNSDSQVFILCPLAVAPAHHSTGIGTTLIQRGLEILKDRGAQVILVLGDPNYYSRAGFHTEHKVTAPYPLPYPEAWMAQALQGAALENLRGTARCATPLQDPKHW